MPATALVTSEQYLALPDEFDQSGNRIRDELIGGEIVPMPPTSLLHDRVKMRIGFLLASFVDARPELRLEVLIEAGSKVSEYDTFVPDVAVVSLDQLQGSARILQGPPDLAIEIISPSETKKKITQKRESYLKSGSKTVWLVSVESRAITVYTSEGTRQITGDQSIEDPLLPGFSTPVSTFFQLA
jgi:Uma2 family endonuclease